MEQGPGAPEDEEDEEEEVGERGVRAGAGARESHCC